MQNAQCDVAVIAPHGRFDIAAAPQFRDRCQTLIKGGSTRLVVDMSAVSAIDSSGLGALIAGMKQARQAGGDLRIVSPGPKVTAILEWTNLGRILKVCDSVETAYA